MDLFAISTYHFSYIQWQKCSRVWRNDYKCETDAPENRFQFAIAAIVAIVLTVGSLVGYFGYRKYASDRADHDLLGYDSS